jgi:hypothetical protein
MNINVFFEVELLLTVSNGGQTYVSRYLVPVFFKFIKNYYLFIYLVFRVLI